MSEIVWQKSSYSGSGDTNCVEIGWQKSSYSGSGDNNCVEIAAQEATTLALRESDAPTVILHTHGPQLAALLRHITATAGSRQA
ncbi:DUF397 domain-containing protein [Streptomyces bluensis]|uniref:DUF397 domain-containing protein n=1 Tax=Streptomyces bluensis TaxID=33897 RepID=UPI001063CD83|nr:DUF397 domain-containing protein [Streptomyces bluensis]GGZ89289.1 hypothetical protein GCM10010344_66010 [Streptomyces bluensis]